VRNAFVASVLLGVVHVWITASSVNRVTLYSAHTHLLPQDERLLEPDQHAVSAGTEKGNRAPILSVPLTQNESRALSAPPDQHAIEKNGGSFRESTTVLKPHKTAQVALPSKTKHLVKKKESSTSKPAGAFSSGISLEHEQKPRNLSEVALAEWPESAYRVPKLLVEVPAENYMKRAFQTQAFLLRTSNILYRSPRAHERSFKRGVLFGVSLAAGRLQNATRYAALKKKYVSEVGSSARQLREFVSQSTGIALAIDFDIDELPNGLIDLFDYVVFNEFAATSETALRGNTLGWASKVSCMLYTPFEETLYADGDTRFCADPGEVLDSLKHSDLVATKEVREAWFLDIDNKINAGAIGFRRNRRIASIVYSVLHETVGKRDGDQGKWHAVLEKPREALLNARIEQIPPRFHFQRCVSLSQCACIVSGNVVMFHGRIWNVVTPSECERINANQAARYIRLEQGKAIVTPLSNSS